MAIQYNENIKIAAPLPLDSRYLSLRTSGGNPLPYSSTTEVNTTIISSERYIGLTVNINNVEYWYMDGIADGDLILKTITGGTTGSGITGATNLGFFSGKTGIQTLPITHFTNSNYTGNYQSLYNWYYRGTDAKIHTGTPADGIPKRGYLKSVFPVKSWVWNEYIGLGSTVGWILVDGSVESQIGLSPTVELYYPPSTAYTQTIWVTGTAYPSLTDVGISTVTGSLTGGTTLTIGGPPYAKEVDHVVQFRTLISDTPDNIKVTFDESFVHISGITSVLQGENVGGGTGNVFKQRTGTTMQFRTIEGTGDTAIYQVGDRILISATGSVTGTTQAVNVGTGTGVFKSKTGNTLQFRSLLGSGNTLISQVGNDVVIYSSGGGGTITGATNGISLVGVSGATVALGGGLTTPTILTISGSTSLTIDDTRVTKEGIIYGGDYSASFADNSLVTRKYVDTMAIGLQPKLAVWVATTSNITLSGLSTVDGVMTTNGMRVLVKNQSGNTTPAVTNGIYIASGSTWKRSTDFDGNPHGEIQQGALIPVLTGSTNHNTLWVLITPDPITGGTTPLLFSPFSTPGSYVGGTGIDVSGGTISINIPTYGIITNAITGVTNIGSGTSICSGVGSHNITLNTIIGSGTTCVSKVGNEIRIFSSGGGTLTGATNGLSLSGQIVVLGGTLTGNTCICTSVYSLNIGCLNTAELSVNPSSISAFHCANASNGSAMSICNTGLTLSNKVSSISCSVTLGANALVYGGCYHSCYVNRTLVDKEYVDKELSGTSNVLLYKTISNTYYTGRYDDVIGVSGISTNQIYLYPTPVTGQRISVVDICGNALGDPITINGYGKNINNGTCSTINTDYGSVTFVYNGIFWSAIAFVN
jgi:hypothetical protein